MRICFLETNVSSFENRKSIVRSNGINRCLYGYYNILRCTIFSLRSSLAGRGNRRLHCRHRRRTVGHRSTSFAVKRAVRPGTFDRVKLLSRRRRPGNATVPSSPRPGDRAVPRDTSPPPPARCCTGMYITIIITAVRFRQTPTGSSWTCIIL